MMADSVEFYRRPVAKEIYMLGGWRQWADAGAVSSGLPDYLIQHLGAEKIGYMRSDGFYLFQFPGTHDLVRPVVQFDDGFPIALEAPRNDFYYAEVEDRGLVIFLGDEPHMDIDRYVNVFLESARELQVKRIIGVGGVYGEVPYDKERNISCIYSQRVMREELNRLSVSFSDYQGGASIESVICKRAGEQGQSFTGFYAFVPAYELSGSSQLGSSLRIENDFNAWLAILRRLNFLLKFSIPLEELEESSAQLTEAVREKFRDLAASSPDVDVQAHMEEVNATFQEMPFNPLDEVWDEELRRLLDKIDDGSETDIKDED
jgi:predicted ATP-grasp superfamily ATP-dependent carboligase